MEREPRLLIDGAGEKDPRGVSPGQCEKERRRGKFQGGCNRARTQKPELFWRELNEASSRRRLRGKRRFLQNAPPRGHSATPAPPKIRRILAGKLVSRENLNGGVLFKRRVLGKGLGQKNQIMVKDGAVSIFL